MEKPLKLTLLFGDGNLRVNFFVFMTAKKKAKLLKLFMLSSLNSSTQVECRNISNNLSAKEVRIYQVFIYK